MPVFGRTQNARLIGPKSSGLVLIGIGTTEVSEERQVTTTDSGRRNLIISDKIHPTIL